MSSNLLRILGLGASMGLLTSTANAQSASPSPTTAAASETAASPTLTLRVEPVSGIVLWEPGNGAIEVGGLSASLRLFDLLEAEAGAAYYANPCGGSPSPTARLGISPAVVSRSPAGDGWEVRIPLLVDYAYLMIDGHGCDYEPEQRVHLLRAAAGVDVTFWVTPRLGFDLRALGSAGAARMTEIASDTLTPSATTSTRRAAGATLSLGITLPLF